MNFLCNMSNNNVLILLILIALVYYVYTTDTEKEKPNTIYQSDVNPTNVSAQYSNPLYSNLPLVNSSNPYIVSSNIATSTPSSTVSPASSVSTYSQLSSTQNYVPVAFNQSV